MKCRQIEELLPLFAGDDLSEAQAGTVREHLAGCGSCSKLAADLSESVAWFRESPVPLVDNADLAGLRASVNLRIDETRSTPGLLEQFIASIAWRPVLAAAIVLLAVALYAFRDENKPPVSRKPDLVREAEIRDGGEVEDPKPVRDRPAGDEKKIKRNRRLKTRPRRDLIALGDAPPPGKKANPSEPLRIELQTADPNIRIIWLAHTAPGH
ncbi:MAG: zf-HC2 domain-containing protein [Acidobacteriota bacterium]|nr:MAG: zf-HC2 domain-containing protein [Acidobacteriota bacterium]